MSVFNRDPQSRQGHHTAKPETGPATYLGVLSGSLFQEFIHPA